MTKHKLGPYIEKLMITVLEPDQDEFVLELALTELRRLSNHISDFLVSKEKTDSQERKKTEKILLKEKKEIDKEKESGTK